MASLSKDRPGVQISETKTVNAPLKNWEKALTPSQQVLLQTLRKVDADVDAEIKKEILERVKRKADALTP